MKTESELRATRQRLINAAAQFGERTGLPFAQSTVTVEQLHYMALGAIAFSSDALGLNDRPDNIGKIIAVIESENGKAKC